MKSLILYSANTQLTIDHQCVRTPLGTVFIRVEPFDGDVSEALFAASRMPGEIVLNTIPAPTDELTSLDQVDEMELDGREAR